MVMTSDLRETLHRLPRTLRVGAVGGGLCEYTSIQAAINYAATQAPSATNPWTIYIYPGIYTEAITCSSWVNLKGIGPKGSVVVQTVSTSILTVADNVELSNFIVRMTTPNADNIILIRDTAVSTVIFDSLNIEVTTPGAWILLIWYLASAGTYTIRNCFYNIGGTGVSLGIVNAGSATIHLMDNDFIFTNANASHLRSESAGTWTGSGNRWAGTGAMFNVINGTLTFDNDAMICTGAWVNTNATIILRNCAIEASVVAGNGAIVRMKNCSYRQISRSGTGNIVDESPQLQDAPWHVEKWNWAWVIAQAQISIRGTPQDAGTGQVLLEVNTGGAADAEAVETFPEIAGALGNEFTPARTPRFLGQIAVDTFHADADMFFGLREALANLIPDITTEECAGFDWNGANFRAISSDGGGVGVFTNLTTPSVNVQHQLEVIIFGGVQVEFYVDGVLVATHSTAAGRPTAVLDWQFLLNNGVGGGAAADIDVTVRNGGCQSCPT